MDSGFSKFTDYTSGLANDDDAFRIDSNPYLDIDNNFVKDDLRADLGRPSNATTVLPIVLDPVYCDLPSLSVDKGDKALLFPSPNGSSGGGSNVPSMSLTSGQCRRIDSLSPTGDGGSLDSILKYINHMLMEDNMEKQNWLFEDQIALQNAEKSWYDALGEAYPTPPNQPSKLYVNYQNENPHSNFSGNNGSTCNSIDFSNSFDHGKSCHGQPKTPTENFHYNLDSDHFTSTTIDYGDGSVETPNDVLIRNVFTDSESMLQIKKGYEEASKFLPSGTQLIIDSGVYFSALEQKKQTLEGGDHDEKTRTELSANRARRSDIHERDDAPSGEGRANKQTALSLEESKELSEMFDRVLLSVFHEQESVQTSPSKDLRPHGQKSGGRGRGKKQGSKNMVDLRTTLILCAQAVSATNFRKANELLKQIRENSSPSGDASQRVAHYFANGLEARLVGSGNQTQDFYTAAIAKRISATDILKAYHATLSSSPFDKFPIFFANYMIYQLAEQASVIHIIDFGIMTGFQWPILIKNLSERPGGTPKVRITGIEFPQPGFRPTDRVAEPSHRLAKYCERFGVPFEYNGIASQNWESIKVEDLKIHKNEFVAVNSLRRFKNLLDETVGEENSPRDMVLNLIRKINPDVFVHVINNGFCNSPFFVTRFREALFYYSAVYDTFDATISCDNEQRLVFERDVHGQEIMNAIACEGRQRIERPETYKQWQVRHIRAGFRTLPLDQDFLALLRARMKEWYHKDFVLDEDNNWMLLGWRGRILYASACWVPA